MEFGHVARDIDAVACALERVGEKLLQALTVFHK
jgi:hypothetical protein